MKVFKSPDRDYALDPAKNKIFLAGSIEMGKASNWQKKLQKDLADFNVVLLNPRRDDWNSDWAQEESNAPFKDQVLWELEALDAANMIVFFFEPGTVSPVTLMEFGLHAGRSKHIKTNMVLCCPEGYFRKGNLDITSQYFKVPSVHNYEQLVEFLKTGFCRNWKT